MEYNKILLGDSYEILPTLPDKSFDAVIIDPPYGMGIDEWDKPVDVVFFTEQIKRIGREFYAVFGQMPHIRAWDRQAEKSGLFFSEHISWVKRMATPNNQYKLKRGHEEVFVYALGKTKKLYKTTGCYEDVRVPGIMYDINSIEAIRRLISDLRLKNERGYGSQINRKQTTSQTTFKQLQQNGPCFNADQTNFTNVWSFMPESLKNRDGKYRHPTEKPELLQMRLVEMLTPEYGSVLDCFSGSGTTAIACKRLNRQFLCIEKEENYYELSLTRLQQASVQGELMYAHHSL